MFYLLNVLNVISQQENQQMSSNWQNMQLMNSKMFPTQLRRP